MKISQGSFFAVGLVPAIVLSGALFADEPGSIVVDAKPGTCWQADWRWTERDMPLTALVHPRITAWDAKGRKIFDRDVGRRQQRVYDPRCPADIKWRVYVTIGDGQKKVRGSLHALHTVDLPKTTTRFGLSVRRYGDDAILTNLTCAAILLADIPKPPRSSYPNIDESGCRILSDAELDATLSAREYLRPKLAVHGDRTELVVNGKVVVPKILKGADRLNANRYPAISLHAQDGFNIFTVGFQFNESAFPAQAAAAGIWRPDGSCDLGKIRLGLRECLRRNPAAMVMMVLSVAPYNGWGERHPSEIYRDEKGRYGVFTGCRVTAFHDRPEWNYAKSEYPAVSYASETFADEAAAFVEKMFRELERLPEAKNVIGVYVNGGTDTQWLDLFDNRVGGRQAVDRSDVACRRFAEYRRRKYGRDDIEAKIPPDADFWTDDRQFYSEHETTVLSDYREFLAQASTQMRLKLSRAVKRGSGGRLLTGSYSPAGGLSGFPLISQTFTAGLLASDDFDFFAVVPGYTREYVDPVLSAIYDGSCLQRGKLYISELDLRSSEVLHWGVWGSDFWRENHDAHTFRRKTLSFAANAFVHGGTYHAYDLNNAWFATPGGRAAWRAAAELARIVRPMPLTDERIALVGGERFFDFQSFGKSRTFPYLFRELPRVALAFSGVPWNCYLLDDVLASSSSTLPKVIVFTDLSAVTHERYNEIRRRWANSGRVLVWMHRPGVFAKDGEKIERDLGLAPAPDAYGKLPFADGSSDDPLMAGVKGTVMAMHPSYHYAKSDLSRPLPEKGWKTLANFAATDIPALAVRRTEGLVEVYASVPGGLTPQLCRNLAREAGFSPVVESNDISGFGSGILYVLAQTSGEKVFRLPKGTSPGKVVEGPAYRACGDGFVVELKRGDLFILEVNDDNPVTAVGRTYANPVDLPYRIRPEAGRDFREGADPEVVVHEGRYWMFASKCGGYFVSDDLASWRLVATEDLPLEEYAPTAWTMNGRLYFSSRGGSIHRAVDPAAGKWERLDRKIHFTLDSKLFFDEGRLFNYAGAGTNRAPIQVQELDSSTFVPIGPRIPLFEIDDTRFGWDVRGDHNEMTFRIGYKEGANMLRCGGTYYFQYATPGTQFASYCDVAMIGASPTGPFRRQQLNPFSYKSWGYIKGAGHGSTFRDRHGNWWHATTGVVRDVDRRIVMFPVFFDPDGEMWCDTAFADWPIVVPDRKVSSPEECRTGWMPLTYAKRTSVSSSAFGASGAALVDEDIRTSWSAATGNPGEWAEVDFGGLAEVRAVQVAFADDGNPDAWRRKGAARRWRLEASVDGNAWQTVVDESNAADAADHPYRAFETLLRVSKIRVVCVKMPEGTRFALREIRAFGCMDKACPLPPKDFVALRNETDRRRINLSWRASAGATGYLLRYGPAPDKLHLSLMVRGDCQAEIRSLDARQDYCWTIEAFNEAGMSKAKIAK